MTNNELPNISKQLEEAIAYWYSFADSFPKEMFHPPDSAHDLARSLFDKWLDTQAFKTKETYRYDTVKLPAS